jgi:hypothetical protein
MNRDQKSETRPHAEEGTVKSPWQPVAEWLRAIRARTAGMDEDNPSPCKPDSVMSSEAPAHGPKLKFRFVCDRHVIGFVFGRK